MKTSVQLAACLLFLSLPAAMLAAELKEETLRAWDDYLQKAASQMTQRLHAGKFLWVDESPERVRAVRQGTVVVAPAGERTPQRVPSGLIHDWIGAVFIPSVRVADVLDVVRSYDSYKEFYKPTVIDSRQIAETAGQEYRFSMVLLNQDLFAKSALESDYKASYVQVDVKRWYSVTSTTRVQEIDDYGQPGQHRLPVNQGAGYVWRLYSLARFEERDGGVYVELEAMALSREVPASIRWVVEPIIRRIAKSSLQLSLRQTAAHLLRPGVQVAQVAAVPAFERR